MRHIVLDTETTGLEVHLGHRLIEIGAVEMVGRRLTGENFHTYLNPERAIDEGARQVTGIEDEFLLDKPKFAEVVERFIEFIRGAELIIHNAAFDVGFLDAELKRAGAQYGCIADHCTVLDTLAMAREMYPGQRNSLDALCKRLGVDNAHRELHGGLLDAQLLADVYIAMTSGQVALDLGFAQGEGEQAERVQAVNLSRRPRVLRASEAELGAHAKRLDALDKAAGSSLWRQLETAGEASVEA
ncbi:DNA polymerase III subunit epsilon [Oleiagrimonas sp. C23AA]|uniref:DNA polymerase III subunit epsilon n=1 Tax=Oleiagrimonas sp. C23AA TaxID=2719047 RepID=UPI001421EB60|nr:DNA polymerase III subunit epsilon [Oleiagrimonas sp. C23AA]